MLSIWQHLFHQCLWGKIAGGKSHWKYADIDSVWTRATVFACFSSVLQAISCSDEFLHPFWKALKNVLYGYKKAELSISQTWVAFQWPLWLRVCFQYIYLILVVNVTPCKSLRALWFWEVRFLQMWFPWLRTLLPLRLKCENLQRPTS